MDGVSAFLFVLSLIWLTANVIIAVDDERRKKQLRLADANRAALPEGQRPTLIGMAGAREDVYSLRWTDVLLLRQAKKDSER